MKGKPLVTAVSVLFSAVAVNAQATTANIHCPYWNGHITLTLFDTVTGRGGKAAPEFSYSITSDGTGSYYNVPVSFTVDWCLDGECHHEIWPQKIITPTHGLNIGYSATLTPGKIMPDMGTYESSFTIHTSKSMGCSDAVALAKIVVQ